MFGCVSLEKYHLTELVRWLGGALKSAKKLWINNYEAVFACVEIQHIVKDGIIAQA